jgi:hypothetical protein
LRSLNEKHGRSVTDGLRGTNFKRKEQQTIDDLENLLDIFEKNKIR